MSLAHDTLPPGPAPKTIPAPAPLYVYTEMDPREPDGSICDTASEGEEAYEGASAPDACMWCDGTGSRLVMSAGHAAGAESGPCAFCEGSGFEP